MTRNDAAVLMTSMARMLGHDLTDDELELWYGVCLERIDGAVGAKTVERIIAGDKKWPVPARFNEMRRAVEADEIPVDRQVQAGPRTAQERANVARFQALCREVIAARDRRPHWHGGPEPCVVCGGLNPKVAAQQARAALRQARSEK